MWALAALLWHVCAAGTFLVFSDMHMDPFYGTADGLCAGALPALGRFGCDSPPALVQGKITLCPRF